MSIATKQVAEAARRGADHCARTVRTKDGFEALVHAAAALALKTLWQELQASAEARGHE